MDSSPPTFPDDLIDPYLAGELDVATAERVRAYLEANSGRRGVIAGIRGAARAEDLVPSVGDVEVGRKALLERVAQIETHVGSNSRMAASLAFRDKSKGGWSRKVTFAVTIAALSAFAVVFRIQHSSDFPAFGERRYTTTIGQQSRVQLADGSTMIVAPSTSVVITPREVDVVGEAYFSIAPRSTRSMIIRTSNAAVHVLGTRFSVRQYPGERRSRVVVEEGRVALQTLQPHHSNASRAVLSSGMLALVTDSGVTVSSGIVTREYTSWTQGTLVFNRVALSDVATELARAYGAMIRIEDPALAKRNMHMDVSVADTPLAQVLDEICKVTESHYVKNGQTYVLLAGRTPSPSSSHGSPRYLFPQSERQYGR